MMNDLFNQTLMRKYSKNFKLTPSKHDPILKHIQKLEEGQFEAETKNYIYFYEVWLKGILGYDLDENVLVDEKEEQGRGKSEFILRSGDKKFMVVELKDQKTDLDKPQNRVNDKRTPVDQAFDYAQHTGDIDWILVSNYNEFRLYNWHMKGQYISFNVGELLDKTIFSYFMLSFSKKSHIETGFIDKLMDKTVVIERELEKEFYKLYNETRLMLIKEFEELNKLSRLDAIHYAQMIMNRYMFICFAEDIDLLPAQVSTDTILTPILKGNLRHGSIWQRLNELFLDVNEGNEYKKISQYNGGIFKENLDHLKIRDIVEDQKFFNDVYQSWKFEEYEKDINTNLGPYGQKVNPIYRNMLTISTFDFSTELDVNILGHIFENSIGDIEELKEGSKGRRKKEGIFYTPEYITDYICKNTIIPYLSKSGKKNTIPDLIGEYWGSALEELDQKVKNIKVVDPACGSGAFLNKAADILLKIHQKIHETRYKDKKETLIPYFDNIGQRREILLNNIYGVDLNEESVDITKLSLFLKVCRKGLILPNLEKNIKCGNSLIDDPEYTDKPFKWEKEFPDIFQDGGFDVVIGNPPYFNIQTLGANSSEVEYIKNNYPKIWMDKSDILFYFICKSIEITKKYVSLIVSNAFLFSDKAKKLRNYILEIAPISEIVNFEKYMVFDDASITTAIVTFEKQKTDHIAKALPIKESKYSKNEIKDLIYNYDNYFNVEFKKNNVFALIEVHVNEINEKIDRNHPTLNDIVMIGKGMETAADKIFIFDTYPEQFPPNLIKKRVSGINSGRYYVNPETDYILYFEFIENFEDLPDVVKDYLLKNKEVLKNRADKKRRSTSKWWNYTFAMHKEYYNLPKLFCSRRAPNNTFSIDEGFKYLSFSNMTVIFDNNPKFSIKYILTLLNSKLLNFRYKTIGKQTGGGVFEYFPNGVGKLPIPGIDLDLQKPFTKKAEELMDLNDQLTNEINSFKKWLKYTFKIDKFSKKFDKYYELSFNDFLTELNKKKVDTKQRKTQELLRNEFEESKAVINPLLQQIKETDNEIDQMVYDLYGLTPEEIQIIGESL